VRDDAEIAYMIQLHGTKYSRVAGHPETALRTKDLLCAE
jgi:hypothetical protein